MWVIRENVSSAYAISRERQQRTAALPTCAPQLINSFRKRVALKGLVESVHRNNRVVKVERRVVIGTEGRFAERWLRSEDSSTLNTSFIERLNLTIRQGSTYLCRRTICQARRRLHLERHLELLRCYYNFVRPHRSLKFGRETRTPAIQAGLSAKRLTLRNIFCSGILQALCKFVFVYRAASFSAENAMLHAA